MKGKNEVREVTGSCKFGANEGYFHSDLLIENGEIVETVQWDSQSKNASGTKKGEAGFEDSCRSTINFIVEKKPAKLREIYNALTDESMREYCRQVQKRKMAELEF